jgi:hypothetical protein
VVGAQTIRGIVIDENARTPIRSASITAFWDEGDSIGSITTDSAGAFFVRVPHAGDVFLRVASVGYRPVVTEPIDVGAADIVTVEIAIAASPFALQPMRVEAQRGPLVTGTMLDGYHERRYWLGEQLGLGTFITRDALDNRNALNVSDVLRTVPSLRLVRNTKTGGWNVQIGVPSLSLGHGCRLAKVLVDGVWANRWGDRNEEDNDIDLMAVPDLIEGIEVYRGGSQMPAEFGGPTSRCGVVAIWTRRGR